MAFVRAIRAMPDVQKGMLLVVIVTFFFSSMDTVSKTLSQTYEPLFVVWWRYFVHTVLALIIFAPRLKNLLKTDRPGLHLLRSLLLFVATILFYYAFATLPLADATAIAQVAPLAITALAVLILGEKIGLHRWASVVIGFVGALIIARPGFGAFGWAGLLPLGGALCFAAYSIATRFLSGGESVWTTFIYTGVIGALASCFYVPFVWQTPAVTDLPLFFAVGLFGAIAQGTLIIALSFAPASTLAPLLYFSLIWGASFGFIIFDEVPDFLTISGAAIIVGAGLYVRHRERVRTTEK